MILAPLVLLGLLPIQDGPNRCLVCHPDVRVEFERSVHKAEQVTCVACHGGDATALTVEAAHRSPAAGGDYKGKPNRADVPALCAKCHSDIRLMRAYNLPTDQHALYQTSVHGQKLLAGDTKVAVCIDCHGVHRILRHDDPESPTFARNVPKTCARCHSDPALMKGYGKTTDPHADFTHSVHGRALEKGNPSAPDCAHCHGAHGATPAEVGDINKLCGHCHTAARTYFRQSPHLEGMSKAGLPECASCHHHHKTGPADVELTSTMCLTCHAQDSPQVAVASKMRALYKGAREEIEQARAIIDQAAAIPLYVDDYLARLEEARTSLLEVLPMVHTLDVDRVADLTARTRSICHEVESELSGKLAERGWRRVGLGVFWFYLLLTVAILVWLRNRAAPGAASP